MATAEEMRTATAKPGTARRWSTGLSLALCAVAVFAWNVSRFIGAEPQIRTSTALHYLPDQTLARTLTFGHASTQAKLQWIDSFSYWQHLLDTGGQALMITIIIRSVVPSSAYTKISLPSTRYLSRITNMAPWRWEARKMTRSKSYVSLVKGYGIYRIARAYG